MPEKQTPEPTLVAAEMTPPPVAAAPSPTPPSPGDIVRLQMKVDELERRLRARTLELETEVRAKERMRTRVEELTKRADEIQETAVVLHREAVSATALSRELDETLHVASEARKQLGDALAAERSRREAGETMLESLNAEMKKRETELKEVRLDLHALRQKTDGQQSHIESLRSELAQAQQDSKVEVETRAARVAELTAELELARGDLRRFELRMASERGTLEAELRALREKSQEQLANAEKIRREGVEAFENARELKLRTEREEQTRKKELEAGWLAVQDSERRVQMELESVRQELSARADRESNELRDALEAERARLYADLESERRAQRAAPDSRGDAGERVLRLHADSQARRRDIAAEVESYLTPPDPAKEKLSQTAPVEAAPQAEVVEASPRRKVWFAVDVLKFAIWVAVGISIVVVVVLAGLAVSN